MENMHKLVHSISALGVIRTLGLVTLFVSTATAAQRLSLPSGLLRVTALSDLSASPDAGRVLFSRTELNEAGDQRVTSFWILDLDIKSTPYEFAAARGGRSLAWSPDNSHITFLRADDRGFSQLYLAPVAATEGNTDRECPLTQFSGGVDHFRWAPDGRSIAIVTTPSPFDKDPLPPGVHIFTRADYRQVSSYVEFSASAEIWVLEMLSRPSCNFNNTAFYPEALPIPRKLASHNASLTMSFWSSDSKNLFYTIDDTPEPYYGDFVSTLHKLRVSDGASAFSRALEIFGSNDTTGKSGNEVQKDKIPISPAPGLIRSPSGERAAFVTGNPAAPPSFAQPEIYILDLASGAVEMVTGGYDREVGGINGSEVRWLDDERLVAVDYDEGNFGLVEINVRDKTVRPWWKRREGVVRGLEVVKVGEAAVGGEGVGLKEGRTEVRVLTVASDFVTPSEIWEIVGETDNKVTEAVPLTGINTFLTEDLRLRVPENISYRGPGGQMIRGWMYTPPSFEPDNNTTPTKHSLLLYPHSGPYYFWNSNFIPNLHVLADAGYFVLTVNPRGSMSYGQDFASALADRWPGPDYDDYMAGVDHVLSTYATSIDATKVGILGGSAGGILVDWAITHTTPFAAAVSYSDIADNSAYWSIGDVPFLQRDDNSTQPPPWRNPLDVELSSITHGLNASTTTPTLFLSGTRDFRTPAPAGGQIMFRLLKYLRVPTALVQFDGAGHGIDPAASDDPRHAVLSLHYQLRWLGKWLKGEAAPEFDVLPVAG